MAMRKTHTPEQIIDLLRQVERETNQGKTVAEACRALSISEWSFYRWRKKYGGMEKGDAKQLKELEKENARLKKLLAEKELDLRYGHIAAARTGILDAFFGAYAEAEARGTPFEAWLAHEYDEAALRAAFRPRPIASWFTDQVLRRE